MKKISTQKVLLVPYKKLHELDMEIKTLKEQPLEVQKDLAIKDLDLYEFIDLVNFIGQDKKYNLLQECYALVYDTSKDYIFAQMGEHDDSIELVVNKELELHIKHEDGGYSVDSYKFFEGEEDEHDYDNDFIGSFWVSQDDLMEDEDI